MLGVLLVGAALGLGGAPASPAPKLERLEPSRTGEPVVVDQLAQRCRDAGLLLVDKAPFQTFSGFAPAATSLFQGAQGLPPEDFKTFFHNGELSAIDVLATAAAERR